MDDDGEITDPNKAAALLVKEIRRLEGRLTQQGQETKRMVETAEYGIRLEGVQEKLGQAVDALNAKHGRVFTDLDIVKEKNLNPNLTLAQAAQMAERRKLKDMAEAGYHRQVPKEKERSPLVPGPWDAVAPPAWEPKKRARTMEELKRNTAEALRHSGLADVVAEANRIREERIDQMMNQEE